MSRGAVAVGSEDCLANKKGPKSYSAYEEALFEAGVLSNLNYIEDKYKTGQPIRSLHGTLWNIIGTRTEELVKSHYQKFVTAKTKKHAKTLEDVPFVKEALEKATSFPKKSIQRIDSNNIDQKSQDEQSSKVNEFSLELQDKEILTVKTDSSPKQLSSCFLEDNFSKTSQDQIQIYLSARQSQLRERLELVDNPLKKDSCLGKRNPSDADYDGLGREEPKIEANNNFEGEECLPFFPSLPELFGFDKNCKSNDLFKAEFDVGTEDFSSHEVYRPPYKPVNRDVVNEAAKEWDKKAPIGRNYVEFPFLPDNVCKYSFNSEPEE